MRLSEQQIISRFPAAIANHYLTVYYQPQINHATGRMVGCEGLLRWIDPDYGIQYPGDFIPVLESNGLIVDADLYVVNEICKEIRCAMDDGRDVVPASFNVSRLDLANDTFIDRVADAIARYEIQPASLRAEITESSIVGGFALVRESYERFHALGIKVEMDDFGSGYSSLSVLKDLPVDVLKLDMRFWGADNSSRTGAIVSSIIRMAKWLETPVIAEGVETREQADYLKSIGCDYIQGYVYAKPMPVEDFRAYTTVRTYMPAAAKLTFNSSGAREYFWSADEDAVRFFEQYSGASAFFNYNPATNKASVVRVNQRYLSETGMNHTTTDVLYTSPWTSFDEASREAYEAAIRKVIATGEPETVETWRTLFSQCCGLDRVLIRSEIQLVATEAASSTGPSADHAAPAAQNSAPARSASAACATTHTAASAAGTAPATADTAASAGPSAPAPTYLLHALIRNVTEYRNRYDALADSERKFRTAAEQANVYAWEYTVATREMRPCYRCMRDLGLPVLVKNYPEPVIESGLFPADYADLYRDWHKQIATGVPSLEAVIPLTADRIPFIVRYTTEYDELGKPVKAYGSATMVVE